jgi:uncharacterized protein YdhG (YjbR/CyaY superfamily)
LTTSDYIAQLPEDRQPLVQQMLELFREHLPEGFEEAISYGMIGFVVPKSLYPDGYHCDPSLPLPFIAIAAQKHFTALYHMGIYARQDLCDWFTHEYQQLQLGKLDMGKSCIRFKKPEKVPWKLLEELAGKMTVEDWISLYEEKIKR